MSEGSYNIDDADRPRWGPNTRLVARYEYLNADGSHAYYVDRGRNPNGEKVFRVRRCNLLPLSDRLEAEDKVNELSGKADDQPWVPYNLPAVMAAPTGTPILLCEGEKDADRLNALGHVATTLPCGAGKWQDQYKKFFAGRDVLLLIDNDPRGREHGSKVGTALEGLAASVRVVELPGLPEKGDVSDWLDAGKTREDLLEALKEAKPFSEWANAAGQFHCAKGSRVPLPTIGNVRLALSKLGATVRFDSFASREVIDGLPGFGPILQDAALRRLWLATEERFKLVVPKQRFVEIVLDLARRNAFHPVRDYLDGLTWDGVARIDTWLTTYAGAADTPFVRAVGPLMLLASVRRVRQPGCKFDEMIVLESVQGKDKSSALEVLAVKPEWFSDDLPLNADSKIVIEKTSGHWIIEAGELKGMRRGEVEHIKSMLSRREDVARLAYGHLTERRPRQFTIWGTTNNDAYLRDSTGNRWFWPVKVQPFDLERLRADRDQLWAEAAAREAKGASIRLPPELWAEAAQEQEERETADPFLEVLASKFGHLEGKVRTDDVWAILGVETSRRTQDQNVRLGEAMQVLGWRRRKLRFGGSHPEHAYAKGEGKERVVVARWWDPAEGRYDVWVGLGEPPMSAPDASSTGGTFPPASKSGGAV